MLVAVVVAMLVGATVLALSLRGGDEDSTGVPVVTPTVAPPTTAALIAQPTTTLSPPPPTTLAPVPTITIAPAPPTIITAAPTTPAPTPAPTAAPTPVPTTASPPGEAIETRCVRPNIDFAAVREAPGVNQAEVGRIPPATCDVQVFAAGTDGRIPWIEVGVGGIFGWSAESNFLPPGVTCAPDGSTCE